MGQISGLRFDHNKLAVSDFDGKMCDSNNLNFEYRVLPIPNLFLNVYRLISCHAPEEIRSRGWF